MIPSFECHATTTTLLPPTPQPLSTPLHSIQHPACSCGGIASGEDALEFMEAGATVVQFYTALAYQGPGLVREIKDHLTAHCTQHQLDHIAQVVGRRAEELSK